MRVSRNQMQSVIEIFPAPEQSRKRPNRPYNGRRLDVSAYLADHGVECVGQKPHGDSTLYLLANCIFDPSHSGKEAAIGQAPDGKLFYQCFHDSCQGRTWHDARQKISGDEPLFEAAIRKPGLKAFTGYGEDEKAATMADWEPSVAEWPAMDESAFYGLAGDFVELASRNSEADPAAILATFLVRFGVECGNAPTLYVGDTKHKARLASVIVGNSSKARKGTSGKSVARLYELLKNSARFSPGPFSSGEGIIFAVRDAVTKWDEKKQAGVVSDPGVEDKRLFILDEEFSGAMANTKREGNTLSTVIRSAWDTGNLDPLTKTCKTTATGAHVGWVSHITLNELNSRLDTTEAFNGFANRILWVCARRAKIVPWPEPMSDNELDIIRTRLADALAPTRENDVYLLKWSDTAKDAWINQYYTGLTKDNPGLIGCVINRAEAQVIRLAMTYCLLDGLTTISILHLEAALAFWNYCEQSARYIFHGRQVDQVAQRILDFLKSGPRDGRALYELFNNNVKKQRIEAALSELKAANMIESEIIQTGKRGRPTTLLQIKNPNESNETNELNAKGAGINSFNSFNSSGDSEIEVEV